MWPLSGLFCLKLGSSNKVCLADESKSLFSSNLSSIEDEYSLIEIITRYFESPDDRVKNMPA